MSIKHRGVLLLLPRQDACPSQVYPPSSMLAVPIYTPGWIVTKWSKVPCWRKQCDRWGLHNSRSRVWGCWPLSHTRLHKYWYTAVFIHFTIKINIINISSTHSCEEISKKIWGDYYFIMLLLQNCFEITSLLPEYVWSCWFEMTLYHGYITFVPLGCSRMGVWGKNCCTRFSKRFDTCVYMDVHFCKLLKMSCYTSVVCEHISLTNCLA